MEDRQSQKCDNCGGLHRFIIHNVSFQANLRRFCTACVLKSFPQSFCAICFRIFETLPPPPARAMCLNCPSISHLSCCATDRSLVHKCPHCQNPNANLFDVKFGAKGDEIDLESAAKLYAAAWIASASMKKALIAAQEEASKKVRAVVLARRNAKEALERLSTICNPDVGENNERTNGEDQERGDSSGADVVEESSRKRQC